MCKEYKGPQQEYLKRGVMYFHAPTNDMCEPSYATIVDCVAFLRTYHNDPKNKGKEDLFIAKGGADEVAVSCCVI